MADKFTLKILPAIHADGPTQMAFDLALLDHAESEPDTIWLRTYTWSAPTLSLGYFQTWRELPELLKKPWNDVAVVRRPTGGGAIWHDADLTYAVVVPSGHPWTAQPRILYQAIHDALAAIMAADGASLRRRRQVFPGLEPAAGASIKAAGPFLCFDDGDADDLILDGHKIVGGAQRRRAWATLQHGSIHWQRSSHVAARHLRGLLDLCPDFCEPSHVKWGLALGPKMAELWGIPYESVGFPAEVVLAAHGWSYRLREPEWLDKR